MSRNAEEPQVTPRANSRADDTVGAVLVQALGPLVNSLAADAEGTGQVRNRAERGNGLGFRHG
nr:hypothetical protein [Flagellatimonas centrodinii]